MQITAPGKTAGPIDQLRSAGITLTCDPETRTLRNGDSRIGAVAVGEGRARLTLPHARKPARTGRAHTRLLLSAFTVELTANPARLAYTWMDGSPRVVPIWFHWTGDQLVLGSPPKAPKLRALAADPRAALMIDGNEWPHKSPARPRTSERGDAPGREPGVRACSSPVFRARAGGGVGRHAAGKAHGSHRHYARLGRDTGL